MVIYIKFLRPSRQRIHTLWCPSSSVVIHNVQPRHKFESPPFAMAMRNACSTAIPLLIISMIELQGERNVQKYILRQGHYYYVRDLNKVRPSKLGLPATTVVKVYRRFLSLE